MRAEILYRSQALLRDLGIGILGEGFQRRHRILAAAGRQYFRQAGLLVFGRG